MKNYLVSRNNGFFPSVFDDFFDDFFRPTESARSSRIMSTDVKEKDDEYELLIEMPGFKKGDLSIDAEEGYLTISAKRSDESDGDRYLRRERVQSCSRKFYIGDIDENKIKAKFDNGLLIVTVPKLKERISKKKTVLID